MVRDDIDRGQVPLDSQQEGFRHIPGTALSREPGRVRRAVQHYLDVLADSMPVVLTRAHPEFPEMLIVGIDLVPCVGNLPVIRPACLSELPEPVRFAVLVIGLGLLASPSATARLPRAVQRVALREAEPSSEPIAVTGFRP